MGGGGGSKQLKQIIQTKYNIVKNTNWPEANQLAIYFATPVHGFATKTKELAREIPPATEAIYKDSNPGQPNCKYDP